MSWSQSVPQRRWSRPSVERPTNKRSARTHPPNESQPLSPTVRRTDVSRETFTRARRVSVLASAPRSRPHAGWRSDPETSPAPHGIAGTLASRRIGVAPRRDLSSHPGKRTKVVSSSRRRGAPARRCLIACGGVVSAYVARTLVDSRLIEAQFAPSAGTKTSPGRSPRNQTNTQAALLTAHRSLLRSTHAPTRST